jgi:hypothetical protein
MSQFDESGEQQFSSLREGLKIPPEQVEIAKLFPLFVPSSFFQLGNWPGPYTRLRVSRISLTWSIHLPDQTMRYVDRDTARYWDKKGIDWKQLALRNLAEHTDKNPATHEFRRTDGKLYGIAMMHPDGIGPSRLLLQDRISAIFPEGYRIALPEMSCAFGFSSEVNDLELDQIQKLIDDCFNKGTRALAQGIYTPADLHPE